MKKSKKIISSLLIGMILLLSATIVKAQTYTFYKGELNIQGNHLMPTQVAGDRILTCIQKDAAINVSLERGEYWVGKQTSSWCIKCTSDSPSRESLGAWTGQRNVAHYTVNTPIDQSANQDAAYIIAEATKGNLLLSQELRDAIWSSGLNTGSPVSTNINDLAIAAAAYKQFYETNQAAGGFTNLIAYTTEEEMKNVKVGVNQTEQSYTVGPFYVTYPTGNIEGNSHDTKFSWIKNLIVKTDIGEFIVGENGNSNKIKILNTRGEECSDTDNNGTVYNLPKSGEKFYIKLIGVNTVTNIESMKVQLRYLESCTAEMIRVEGRSEFWFWQQKSVGTHRHEQDHWVEDNCPGRTCPYYNQTHPDRYHGHWEAKDYTTNAYVLDNRTTNEIQDLLEYSTGEKVYNETEITMPVGKRIIQPTPDNPDNPDNPERGNLTIQIAGYVFLDQDNGKVNEGNNKLDNGEGLAGIEVYLRPIHGYQQDANVSLKTHTDAQGKYVFTGLNAQDKYYVEFVYNGMLYTNVARLQGNAIDISKATEEAQAHTGNRQRFNSKFSEIGSYPYNYQGRKVYLQEEIADLFKEIARNYGTHANDEKSLFAADCRINAYTDQQYPLIDIFTVDRFNNRIANENYQAIYQEGGRYDQLHVNLGIKARPTFDLALYKDVFNAVLNINGKQETYTYDARKDWQNNGFNFGVNEEDYLTQLRNKYISGTNTNLTTSQVINSGEYTHEYRTEEIVNGNNQSTAVNSSNLYDENKNYAWRNINHTLNDADKLQIRVTYKLSIRNQSTVAGAVTELVDYYDNNYQFERAYVGDQNGNQISGTNVDVSETSMYGAATHQNTNGKYKTIYLRPTEQTLGGSQEQYVYVTFRLINPEQTLVNAGLPDGNKLYTYNFAEINGYKTSLGLIDRDSNPGNFEIANYVQGQTAVEDDESNAPAYVYSHRNSRTIEGTVFEDAITSANANKVNTNKTRFGNGTIDTTDKKIAGIKVELLEIKNNELIVRQTTYTDENGWYGFGAFLPGDYTIRFTYGENDDTALTTSSQYAQGRNDTSYNGQDYGSTTFVTKQGETVVPHTYKVDTTLTNIYTAYNQAKNNEESNVTVSDQTITRYEANGYYWYNDVSLVNKSDATDDVARRNQVNDYARTEYGKAITNHKAEVFNSYINQNTLRNQESNDNGFDELAQAQPMDQKVDTQAKNRELVNELERRTYMYAYTPEIPVEVEYTTKQIAGNLSSGAYTYKITGVDFGVVQRPKSELVIDQDVARIKVTASDGTILFDTDKGVNNLQWIAKGNVARYDKEELVNIILDDELLSGARLEVTYNITVTNNSEQDSNSVTRAKTIINYVANNLNFDLADNNGLWEAVKKEDIQTASRSSYINNEVGANNVKLVDLSTQTTVLKATNENPLTKNLNPGESVTSTLTLKKTLSAESSNDDLSYSNMSEIVEIENTAGRYDHGAIPGNQSLEEQPREHDTSGASRYDEIDQDAGTKNVKTRYPQDGKIIVTPPTGSTMIYYVLGTVVTVILLVGIALIKKFVIDRKN